ncbi:hypothetical protein JKP88DRAFT_189662 [Tribonema minus]|uniref:Transmembrane protein 222 n=1 Tax=Tribonema minus TaxID=303371 RepID=A0A836C8Q6_9STRA|nr:hypothetical protein JKP88DRAFT_189662 [Tribonema minus]
MPFIGHMGIADTDGITYDFAGPYHISVAHMSFGSTTRYLQLDPSKCFNEDWNTAVNRACDVYRERMHQICCDNCHSHVAVALEAMHYRGRERWDMATLAVWMFFRGTYVDATAVLKQWAPFFAVVIVLSFVVHL